jgi:hypothetical protein
VAEQHGDLLSLISLAVTLGAARALFFLFLGCLGFGFSVFWWRWSVFFAVAGGVGFSGVIRDLPLRLHPRFRWHPGIAFAFAFVFVFAVAFAGIRDSLARFKRRPCAGRHLLFFAAAKKSRQKKAAHSASP